MTSALRVAMRVTSLVAIVSVAAAIAAGPNAHLAAQVVSTAMAPAASRGWTSLFDGTTLNGWDGRSDVWKVDAGTITGEVAHGPSSVTDTTYIFWKGGEVSDFELQAEVKTEGPFVNTGIVYRGFVVPMPGRASGAGRGTGNAPYKLAGPQLDFDAALRYAGQYLEVATDRPLLVRRGQILETDGQSSVVGSVGDDESLGRLIKRDDWNQLRIVARGHTLIHIVNGHATAVLVDGDAVRFRASGLLGLQLEGAGRVRSRNILLKVR